MTRKSEVRWSQSAKTHTTGDGIWKTDTATGTVLTVSAVHGTGAGTTTRSTVHIIVHTGATAHGDIAASMILGTTTLGITTLGTTADIGEDITQDTGAGMTLGTIITITTITDGMIRTRLSQDRHIPEEAAARTDTTVQERTRKKAIHMPGPLQDHPVHPGAQA